MAATNFTHSSAVEIAAYEDPLHVSERVAVAAFLAGYSGGTRTSYTTDLQIFAGWCHERISPHSLRHSFIAAALDAGVPIRDVQAAASHADPRTTMRHDRARRSLDRHATYVVSTFVAGATRPE